MANPRSDFGAAITGFVVGGCLLFVIVFGMVKWTNNRYASHHGATATPEAQH